MTRVAKDYRVPATFVSLAVFFGLAFALTSCGTPSQPNSIAGTWTGTVTDASGHQGMATLGLTDDRHDILQGTFSYAASGCSSSSQAVSGKILGGQISLVQTPPNAVPTSLQLAVDSTDQHLTGTYSDTNASCTSGGTIDLTKPAAH